MVARVPWIRRGSLGPLDVVTRSLHAFVRENAMQNRIFPWLVGLVLALVAGLAAGCDSGIKQADRALMNLTPDSIRFNQVALGSTETQFVTMTNDGESTLRVSGVEVRGPQGVFNVDGLVFPFSLEPNQEASFNVTYTPQSTAVASGTIVFDSNSQGGTTSIDVATQALAGRVLVTPNPIDFGRVPAGQFRDLEVVVQNIGTSGLNVSDIFVLTGSGEFEVADEFREPFRTGAGLDLTAAGTEGDNYPLVIRYSPTTDGFDQALLVVRSDEPGSPERTIPIQANGATPCISVNHEDGFNFGGRLINFEASETFTITNCSDAANGETLIVSSIAFTDEYPSIPLSPSFGLQSVPDMPLSVEPGGRTSFVVTYLPEEIERTDRTMLRIASNDDFKDPLDIEIVGSGSNNQCPTAIATCTIRGGAAVPSDEINAIPLDVLDCTGEQSRDEDGTIVEYLWEVVTRPDGSTALPNVDASGVTMNFFVDLAGTYVLRLVVIDNDGLESCTPSDVVVVSVPDEDVHVQLVWDTPGDPDRFNTGFGAGSDADLHFLHPNGCWGDNTWDCHWRNPNPNWGDLTSSTDDPSLDIDDTDGWGPENINLNNPEDGVTYRIGVNYFNDHGYGRSEMTLRLFLFGSKIYEGSRWLEARNDFWEVAGLAWPSAEVILIDRVTIGGFPECR